MVKLLQRALLFVCFLYIILLFQLKTKLDKVTKSPQYNVHQIMRERITKVCTKIEKEDKKKMERKIETVFLSKKRNIGYCRVTKMASTTWTHFFIRNGVFSNVQL